MRVLSDLWYGNIVPNERTIAQLDGAAKFAYFAKPQSS